MKHLVLLVLICSMTGLPVNAIDSPTTVRLFVSSDEDKTLMQAYLKKRDTPDQLDANRVRSMIGTFGRINGYPPMRLAVDCQIHSWGPLLFKTGSKRELRKLDGFKLVEDVSYRNSTWEILVVSITLRDGFYVAGMTIIRNRYMKPYLKQELNPYLKERMETISEYYKSSVHTGGDMQKMCSRMIVLAEEIIRD